MSRFARSCSIKSAISGLLPVSLSKRMSASLVFFSVFLLRILNISYECVGRRVGEESTFPFDCPVDLHRWYLIFFGKRMRHDCNVSPVKEIKYSIIHRAQPRSQFTNAASYQITLRPPQ